ncbi:MAG: hypothetical protein AABX51_04635 [Nanoarchaeota archaeon]
MRIIVFLAVILIATTTVSAAGYFGKVQVPSSSELIVATSQNILDDADLGNNGFWAIDDYNQFLLIFKNEVGYTGIVQAVGNWETFAGVRSPSQGIEQKNNANGTFYGAYMVKFNADGCKTEKGTLPTVTRGATSQEIMEGTYQGVQALSDYCSGISNLELRDWQWVYTYNEQKWIQTKEGEYGDILT